MLRKRRQQRREMATSGLQQAEQTFQAMPAAQQRGFLDLQRKVSEQVAAEVEGGVAWEGYRRDYFAREAARQREQRPGVLRRTSVSQTVLPTVPQSLVVAPPDPDEAPAPPRFPRRSVSSYQRFTVLTREYAPGSAFSLCSTAVGSPRMSPNSVCMFSPHGSASPYGRTPLTAQSHDCSIGSALTSAAEQLTMSSLAPSGLMRSRAGSDISVQRRRSSGTSEQRHGRLSVSSLAGSSASYDSRRGSTQSIDMVRALLSQRTGIPSRHRSARSSLASEQDPLEASGEGPYSRRSSMRFKRRSQPDDSSSTHSG